MVVWVLATGPLKQKSPDINWWNGNGEMMGVDRHVLEVDKLLPAYSQG
jgi:hypothetical protein